MTLGVVMNRVIDQSVWSQKLEDQKAKNWLSLKNCLSQENPKVKNRKNHQKVGIYLILMLRIVDRAF